MDAYFSIHYKKLTGFEKEVLHAFAVAYETVPKTKMFQIMRAANVMTDDRVKVRQLHVDNAISTLKKFKLLETQSNFRINPRFSEVAMVMAVKSPNYLNIVDVVRDIYKHSSGYWSYVFRRQIRELRFAFYAKDGRKYASILDGFMSEDRDRPEFVELFDKIEAAMDDPLWLADYPAAIKNFFLVKKGWDSFLFGFDSENLPGMMNKDIRNGDVADIYTLLLFSKGAHEQLKKVLARLSSTYVGLRTEAMLLFISGEMEASYKKFDEALKAFRSETGKKSAFPNDFSALFYCALLAMFDSSSDRKRLKNIAEKGSNNSENFNMVFQAFRAVLSAKGGDLEGAEDILTGIENGHYGPLTIPAFIFISMITLWFFPEKVKRYSKEYKKLLNKCSKAGLSWMEMEYSVLLEFAEKGESVENVEEKFGMKSLASMLKPKAAWELTLSAIQDYVSGMSKEDVDKQLMWIVNTFSCRIDVKEQRRNKSGNWTSGRAVALKRLLHNEVDSIRDVDRPVISAIREISGYYENGYEIDYQQALVALCGHPNVRHSVNPDTPIELLRDTVALKVEKKKGKVKLGFNVDFNEYQEAHIVEETPNRYRVYEISESLRKISGIMGGTKLELPEKAEATVSELVGQLASKMTVHSSIEGASTVPSVDADGTIRLHLKPVGDAFAVNMVVQPLGEEGPSFAPGEGGAEVIAKVGETSLSTKRNLKKEIKSGSSVIERSNVLSDLNTGDYSWMLQDAEPTLELLGELRQMKDVVLFWPKGKKMSVVGACTAKDLSLSVRKGGNFLSVSGRLNARNDLVLEMDKLLESIENSKGRFIRIGENEFISLEKDLIQKLKALRKMGKQEENEITLHPLAFPTVNGLAEGAGEVEGDGEWKKFSKNIEKAFAGKPRVPSKFNAILREYQKDGYLWMTRLAAIDAGACLADDMGLGKTVQALALLTKRKDEGPSLVLAPTSVTINWLRETEKFAPELKPVIFGNGDRKEQLEDLKAGDLLIASYGLLINEIEALKEIKWSTVVMDEAQAVKNSESKRAKCAGKLNAKFKLATTGTPIENNLSELWSLFNIINPGLLGKKEAFRRSFMLPIERDGDADIRDALKRMVQPFILRRRKDDVLTELPPKTEINIAVKMSAEEASFYEAIRIRALEKLEQQEGPGHIEILAQLMKMRRASCNPRLVDANSKLESAKLEQFEKLTDELLENNHKTLVFSQFVDHLKILEESLSERGIRYHYLDGSVPAKERQKRIDAFQSGDGDVFLISLKAGGTGLNLTEADYVIHMDPWWNPAAEDQASDRAHRMGQKKPVTVYRIVSAGTIEEKIIDLHKKKKDLADSLLEGTETSAKLSAQDLLALMGN